MTSDDNSLRRDRIERMLHELRYEIERGMINREIDETMTYRFYVPISQTIPGGVVRCEFHTVPVSGHTISSAELPPRLRIVKS
jgi:hypothetical protein